jgi:hypothetical protein
VLIVVNVSQPHLVKCFDSIARIDFGSEKDGTAAEVFGMRSGEGEVVPWSAPVSAVGNVEDWLCDVEVVSSVFSILSINEDLYYYQAMMRTSLYDHSKAALAAHPPAGPAAIDRSGWFFGFPAQSIIM